MSLETYTLNSGLEVHFVQQQVGNGDVILDVYELRKNHGKRSSTIKRFEVPEGSSQEYISGYLQQCLAQPGVAR